MPESVDSPAPVRATRRPCRSASGTAISRASTVTGSARVAGARAGTALLRLDLPVLGRGRGHQVVEEMLGRMRDVVHCAVEGLPVGLGRMSGATDLAHELERGIAHLLRGRGRLEVVEWADVAAHGSSLRGGPSGHTVKNSTDSPATRTTRPSASGSVRTAFASAVAGSGTSRSSSAPSRMVSTDTHARVSPYVDPITVSSVWRSDSQLTWCGSTAAW